MDDREAMKCGPERNVEAQGGATVPPSQLSPRAGASSFEPQLSLAQTIGLLVPPFIAFGVPLICHFMGWGFR